MIRLAIEKRRDKADFFLVLPPFGIVHFGASDSNWKGIRSFVSWVAIGSECQGYDLWMVNRGKKGGLKTRSDDS